MKLTSCSFVAPCWSGPQNNSFYEKKGSYNDTNCYKILYEKGMPISEGINTHMRSMLFFSCVWVGEGVHYPF